jgi:hypothetical protein
VERAGGPDAGSHRSASPAAHARILLSLCADQNGKKMGYPSFQYMEGKSLSCHASSLRGLAYPSTRCLCWLLAMSSDYEYPVTGGR